MSPASDCATATALCRAEPLVSCSTAPRPVRRQVPAALLPPGSRIQAALDWRPTTAVSVLRKRCRLDSYTIIMRTPPTKLSRKNVNCRRNVVSHVYINSWLTESSLECIFIRYCQLIIDLKVLLEKSQSVKSLSEVRCSETSCNARHTENYSRDNNTPLGCTDHQLDSATTNKAI